MCDMKEEQDLIPYSDDNSKMGYKNLQGQIVIPAQWNMVYDFHEGLAMVQNWQYGFIDKKGKVVIPLEWDNCESFSEGLAVVERDGRCGYVNKSGELVIPLVWNYAHPFYKGRAIVFDDKQRYIDKEGNVIWTRERTAPQMIKISDTCEMDINDMVIIEDLNELGDVVDSEEFFKAIDDILEGNGRKVHLINKEGDKLVIEHRNFMDSQLNVDNRYIDYEVDIDWYLKNGYMTLEDMKKSIEGDFK